MKKIIIYAIIWIPILFVWVHWGGFKNDFGTLILMIIGVFISFVVKDKIENKQKAE